MAIVDTLGSWIGKQLDEIIAERLKAFSVDTSARVRRAVLDQLAKFSDPTKWNMAILRQSLADDDLENRRHAMWHLHRRGELTADDVAQLLSPTQPDRLAAETLLVAANNPDVLAIHDKVGVVLAAEKRPVVRSVREWISRTP